MSDVQTGTAAPSPESATPATPAAQPAAAPQTPASTAPALGTHDHQGAGQPPPAQPSGWQSPHVPGLTPPEQQTQPPENPAAPGEEAPVERVVPAADGYTLPQGAPQALGQFAHENGFTQEQLDSTMKEFGGYLQTMEQGQKQQLFTAGTQHVESWGEAKAENIETVKRGLSYHDKDGTLTQLLNQTGFINHPVVLNHFLSVGKTLQEGGFLESATHSPKPSGQNVAHLLYPNDAPKQP